LPPSAHASPRNSLSLQSLRQHRFRIYCLRPITLLSRAQRHLSNMADQKPPILYSADSKWLYAGLGFVSLTAHPHYQFSRLPSSKTLLRDRGQNLDSLLSLSVLHRDRQISHDTRPAIHSLRGTHDQRNSRTARPVRLRMLTISRALPPNTARERIPLLIIL